MTLLRMIIEFKFDRGVKYEMKFKNQYENNIENLKLKTPLRRK